MEKQENHQALSARSAVRRFLREHPDVQWGAILKACLAEAERTQGEFAGAWVLNEVKKLGVDWFPNLRPLVVHGVLTRTGVSRGGRRAYYVMPDPAGVRNAMREIGLI